MTVNLGLQFDEFSILASDQLSTIGHVDVHLPTERIDQDTFYEATARYWMDVHRATTHRSVKKIAHNPDTRAAVTFSGYDNELSRESTALLLDPRGYALSNPEVLGILRATRGRKRTGGLTRVLGRIGQSTYTPPTLENDTNEAVSTLAALRAAFVALGEDQAESRYVLMHGRSGETPSFYEVTQNGEPMGPLPIAWGGSGGDAAAELVFARYDVLKYDATPLSELTGIDTIEDAVSLAREAIQHAGDHAFGCAGFSYVIYGQDGLMNEGIESFEIPKEPQYLKALERNTEEYKTLEAEARTRLEIHDTLKPFIEALVSESDQDQE